MHTVSVIEMLSNKKVMTPSLPPSPPLRPPYHFYINPPFTGVSPFLAKYLVPHQVTQFLEGPPPPLPFNKEDGCPTMLINDESEKKNPIRSSFCKLTSRSYQSAIA